MNNNPESTNKHSKHWAEHYEAGALWGLRFLLKTYNLGGHLIFKVCLAPVILYFYIFRKSNRQASFSYLRHMRTLKPHLNSTPLWLQSLQHFWEFGLAISNKSAVWTGKISRQHTTSHRSEVITDLLKKKRGGIVLTSHLGNFEICRALSSTHPDFRLTILVYTQHAGNFTRLLRELEKNSPVKIMEVSEISPATAIILNERLEQGEFIAISADRTAVNNKEIDLTINFLGKRAALPSGPFALAAILKAPLISLCCLRDGQHHDIYFDSLSEQVIAPRKQRQAIIQKLAEDYAKNLENYCLQAPLQWFNFFDFWGSQQKPEKDNANV